MSAIRTVSLPPYIHPQLHFDIPPLGVEHCWCAGNNAAAYVCAHTSAQAEPCIEPCTALELTELPQSCERALILVTHALPLLELSSLQAAFPDEKLGPRRNE